MVPFGCVKRLRSESLTSGNNHWYGTGVFGADKTPIPEEDAASMVLVGIQLGPCFSKYLFYCSQFRVNGTFMKFGQVWLMPVSCWISFQLWHIFCRQSVIVFLEAEQLQNICNTRENRIPINIWGLISRRAKYWQKVRKKEFLYVFFHQLLSSSAPHICISNIFLYKTNVVFFFVERIQPACMHFCINVAV